MAVPTRPIDDADIETGWGQNVHDRVFTPAGAHLSGNAVTMAGAAGVSTLDLSTADDDPGGYLDAANDRAVVPDDGEGLYILSVYANTVDGASTDRTRIFLQVNGSNIGQAIEDCSGGTNVAINVTTIVSLVATDQVRVRAQQLGSGARADVSLQALHLHRTGAEYGAPTPA